jgi:heme O synthase-like polyprenyltransferase
MGIGYGAGVPLWRRTRADARRLFFGSILYLPLLWILMVVNRVAS